MLIYAFVSVKCEKERGQLSSYITILTEQAWLIKDLLYAQSCMLNLYQNSSKFVDPCLDFAVLLYRLFMSVFSSY